jgi:hypothetical protein
MTPASQYASVCTDRAEILIKVAALHALLSFTRDVSKSWVGTYEYEGSSLCVDMILADAEKEK